MFFPNFSRFCSHHFLCDAIFPAVIGSTLQVTELLAQRKLAIDACDAAGWTALHVALFMGRRHISLSA